MSERSKRSFVNTNHFLVCLLDKKFNVFSKQKRSPVALFLKCGDFEKAYDNF